LSIEVLKSKGKKPAEPMVLTLGTQPDLDTKASHVDCHRTPALAP